MARARARAAEAGVPHTTPGLIYFFALHGIPTRCLSMFSPPIPTGSFLILASLLPNYAFQIVSAANAAEASAEAAAARADAEATIAAASERRSGAAGPEVDAATVAAAISRRDAAQVCT